MPSSLTRVLSFVLGFSPRPPASVCGTGAMSLPASFLASVDSHASLLVFATHQVLALRCAYFTTHQPTPLDQFYHDLAHAILLCQCFTHMAGTGISTCSPSPTTIVLGLGPDLPWAMNLPQESLAVDVQVSRLHLVTHTGILSSVNSTGAFAPASALTHAPLPIVFRQSRSFGGWF